MPDADPPAVDPVLTENVEHNNKFFNGTLPGAVGSVATTLQSLEVATLKKHAVDMYKFLTDEDSILLEANGDSTPRVMLVNIPNTKLVQVVYGLGIGSSGIGTPSAIAGKLLVLHGDGNIDIGPPTPKVLPKEMITVQQEVPTMTLEQFSTAIGQLQQPTFTYPLLRRHTVPTTSAVMKLAPIPAHLVLDGFTKELNAAEVLERVLSVDCDEDTADMYKHLQRFLLAVLTGTNVGDNKPYLSHETFMAQPHEHAYLWRRNRFKQLFPALMPDTDVGKGAGGGDNTTNQLILETLLARLLPGKAGLGSDKTGTSKDTQIDLTGGEEKKDESSVGMCHGELKLHLQMCGFSENAECSLLPTWFRECNESGISDSYKQVLIRKHIIKTFKYDDAEPPLTAQMLKMISKRNWLGKDGNSKRPSLLYAMEGLSPFCCADRSADEVAAINEADERLDMATSTTVDDIAKAKKYLKATVPTTADEFILVLKRYANLLFALFSSACPLFRAVVSTINSLMAYSREARDKLSKASKASILWIVLLQSRHFACGNFDILAEFAAMQGHLASKCSIITHAEVPKNLIHEDKSHGNDNRSSNGGGSGGSSSKRGRDNDDDNRDDDAKRAKPNPATWNPKLKAVLSKPLEDAGYPSFNKIMAYCGTDASSIYPKTGSKCTPNAFFGRCFLGTACKKNHSMAPDKDVEPILGLLQKFIDNPKGLKQG